MPPVVWLSRQGFLSVDWLLSVFGDKQSKAVKAYQRFVNQGKDCSSPWKALRHQMYLGSNHFVEEMLGMIGEERSLSEIPSAQRRPVPKSLVYYEGKSLDRDSAIVLAYKKWWIQHERYRGLFWPSLFESQSYY